MSESEKKKLAKKSDKKSVDKAAVNTNSDKKSLPKESIQEATSVLENNSDSSSNSVLDPVKKIKKN